MDQQVRVSVRDPAAAYRMGLGSALTAAGFAVDHPDHALTPASPMPAGAALLWTVRSASDWDELRAFLRTGTAVTTVVLLVDPTPDRHAEALRIGAAGAVPWDAAPERIVAVLSCALGGDTLLPTAVAAGIAASGPPLHDPDWITPEEIGWLQAFATGATVQQVAEEAGYSERALYRVLHGLYGRMRVSNRTEAILQAARWGLLEGGGVDPGGQSPRHR